MDWEISVFPPISAFGTLPAILLAWPGWSGSVQGDSTMTYANLHQFAASIVGALFATTLFVTAAVGPVGQFI